MENKLTEKLENLKDVVKKIMYPIRGLDEIEMPRNFIFKSFRTEAGHSLPRYDLVYFLLNDFLRFTNLGRRDKTAWSFPITYEGRLFLIEYKKMGLGVFVADILDEPYAMEITKKISKAVKISEPFYEWIASKAIAKSNLNVVNQSAELFERYKFYLQLYKSNYTTDGFVAGKGKFNLQKVKEFKWYALSTIEAFFSWTEHLFIHLAIIANGLHSGEEITSLFGAEWKIKFQRAIPLKDAKIKSLYNKLLLAKSEVRNYVSHGAFGKKGEAFTFHSGTGAVPVRINHSKKNGTNFTISGTINFNEQEILVLIEDFIRYLWDGDLAPAMEYLLNTNLPSILTLTSDGRYAKAMGSMKTMKSLIEFLHYEFDMATDMDW